MKYVGNFITFIVRTIVFILLIELNLSSPPLSGKLSTPLSPSWEPRKCTRNVVEGLKCIGNVRRIIRSLLMIVRVVDNDVHVLFVLKYNSCLVVILPSVLYFGCYTLKWGICPENRRKMYRSFTIVLLENDRERFYFYLPEIILKN